VDHSTFNWLGNSSYDELEFEHVDEFAIKYKSFFTDGEPKYSVFDFDMCPVDLLLMLFLPVIVLLFHLI